MVRAWRLMKARYAGEALGEGPRRHGGRWTSAGRPVVYASESLALATLEVLVHLQASAVLASYVTFPIEFPEACVTEPEVDLPENWREFPAPAQVRAIGDAWARTGSSAVLRVPSAVIPSEFNYVLDPAHPDFPGFRLGDPEPFDADARLFGRPG